MNEAAMLAQVVLMGDYVNTHLSATLADMRKEEPSEDMQETTERAIRYLEQRWSDGVAKRNVFSEITREVIDRARRLREEPPAESEDARALDFTHKLLQLGKKEYLPRWNGDRYLISEQGEVLARKMQADLDRWARQTQGEKVSSED